MKKLFNKLKGINTKNVTGYLALLLGTLLFMGCKKEAINETKNQVELLSSKASAVNSSSMKTDAEFMNMYSGLSKQTTLELQQARAATARYRNIENALKDGYTNIGVDVENMGHHYMNPSLVDGTFDIRKPEILVYNGHDDGTQELVAVEYAVPLSAPMPEGFTGSADVWNGTSGFPLWLVHAWVWAYNPDGVFNWTNSSVHLH
ncbi:MAG: hypothetical protein JWO92_34 [Chitinophagaceae bacterium]|nr:hypothetical protein [Chitinophagaceae bacterium]